MPLRHFMAAQVRHDAGGRPLLSAGAVRPFAVDVRREFLVTSGRCARDTAASTEAHSLQLFFNRAGSIAFQAH
jgi:hypothetical protein